MRRYTLGLLGVVAVVIAGCGGGGSSGGGSQAQSQSGNTTSQFPLQVVVTTRPYELLLNDLIPPGAREYIEVTRIVPVDADPATYKPTEDQIRALQSSDMLVMDGVTDLWAGHQTEHRIIAQFVLMDNRGDPDVRMEGTYRHHWVDPKVMTLVAAEFCNWYVVELRSRIPDEIVRDAKVTCGDFSRAVHRLEGELVTALAPYTGTPIVSVHGTLDLLAARYLNSKVIALESDDSEAGGSMAKLAAANAAVREHGIKAIFAETPYEPTIAETLAAQTGAAIVPLDTMGADFESWFELMNQLRKDLVRGLSGDAAVATAGD